MMNCIIVDDKPLSIDILQEYVHKVSFLNISYTTQNPLEALTYIKTQPVDLIFLDIQMPELTGIQLMKILKGDCKIILTTAYPDYALDGYEHDVVDYLLKPVSFERFYRAVEKAKMQIENQPVKPDNIYETTSLFVKTEYKIQRVDFDDILYIEAKQNYILIATLQEKIMTLQSIKNIETKLPSSIFIRVHKSYLVSLHKIDFVEKSRIYIGEITIPIGDSYRDSFFSKLGTI